MEDKESIKNQIIIYLYLSQRPKTISEILYDVFGITTSDKEYPNFRRKVRYRLDALEKHGIVKSTKLNDVESKKMPRLYEINEDRVYLIQSRVDVFFVDIYENVHSIQFNEQLKPYLVVVYPKEISFVELDEIRSEEVGEEERT